MYLPNGFMHGVASIPSEFVMLLVNSGTNFVEVQPVIEQLDRLSLRINGVELSLSGNIDVSAATKIINVLSTSC